MAESCARQTEGLRRRGVALDVVALMDPPDETPDGPQPAVKEIRTVARDGGADYLVIRPGDTGNAAQRVWRLVRRRHAASPYNAVVGFGANFPGFLAVTFAAWLGLPSAVLVRGNDFDRDWFDSRRGFFVRESLDRADLIGAVSTEKVEAIRGLFPKKNVRWTPNGVDVGSWDLLPDDRRIRDELREELAVGGRRVAGLFGEMKFKKRAPLWLGALRDGGLVDKVGLLVVGRIDEETRQILDDPTLSPKSHRMRFHGREKMPALYAACDFVALPSLFGGMPNVLLEAMAAGVVPIASDAGAMGQVIIDGENGFLFPAEDRDAASKATARALGLSDEELSSMSERARAHVASKFTVERELDEIAGMVHSLNGGGPK